MASGGGVEPFNVIDMFPRQPKMNKPFMMQDLSEQFQRSLQSLDFWFEAFPYFTFAVVYSQLWHKIWTIDPGFIYQLPTFTAITTIIT